MKIGLDLDNTLIFYDDAFVKSAAERGLIPHNFKGTKQQVRDHIRKLHDGETEWQKLQGYVYGAGLEYASLYPGVEDFIGAASGCELYIISHKTEFGHFDDDRINLRDAAKAWLKARGLFKGALSEKNLTFASTRKEKVKAIAKLKPDWFIDDLVEVYAETHFPATTRKLLFHTAPGPAPKGDWVVCSSWNAIRRAVFAHV